MCVCVCVCVCVCARVCVRVCVLSRLPDSTVLQVWFWRRVRNQLESTVLQLPQDQSQRWSASQKDLADTKSKIVKHYLMLIITIIIIPWLGVGDLWTSWGSSFGSHPSNEINVKIKMVVFTQVHLDVCTVLVRGVCTVFVQWRSFCLYLDDEYVGSEWFAESGVVVNQNCVDEVKDIILKHWIICKDTQTK